MSSNIPVIGTIRSFKDVQRALENIRGAYKETASPAVTTVINRQASGGASSAFSASVAGMVWYNGLGPPAIIVSNGDMYYDTLNKTLYQQNGSAWTLLFQVNSIEATTLNEVLTGDLVVAYSGGMKRVLFLDPSGADRNVDFTGAYPAGFEIVCFNYGPNTIVLDSLASAISVPPGPGKSIYFDGIMWYDHS